jgi:putative transposase
MELIVEAEAAGARRSASCEAIGLDLRRLQRWECNPEAGDQRQGPISVPAHALTQEEKKMIIEACNSARFRDHSPWQIVAKLADSGQYLASESSFYRVLKEKGLLNHRGRAKPRQRRERKCLIARKPNEVWSWDITFLKSPIKGAYYYLYLVEDVFSRMIVAWSVEEVESSEHASRLMEQACKTQEIRRDHLWLHSDNGGPMKGATMLATLQRLGVMPSFSRPNVSDDNPYSESLFRTLKYRPSYPDGAFANLEEARTWVERFVNWYNTEHLHSGIKFVTPQSRHDGKDQSILHNRTIIYEEAKASNPLRWSRKVRDWSRISEVVLNPGKEQKADSEKLRNQAA